MAHYLPQKTWGTDSAEKGFYFIADWAVDEVEKRHYPKLGKYEAQTLSHNVEEATEKNMVKQGTMSVIINRLENAALKSPLSVLVEQDGNSYLARTPDIPVLYGIGDEEIEAIGMLKREIESLCQDLKEEEALDKEWESIRKLLNELVVFHEK